jgi:hypothetical protein
MLEERRKRPRGRRRHERRWRRRPEGRQLWWRRCPMKAKAPRMSRLEGNSSLSVIQGLSLLLLVDIF